MVRCKGTGRICFITDSLRGSGNPPGIYRGLIEASILCSRTPARVLGFGSKGSISVGMDADIIILDKDLELKHTILAGSIKYSG